MTSDIVDLNNVPCDINLFGGKAVTLSKIHGHGLSVPHGFVVSSNCYHYYIHDMLNYDDFSVAVNNWLDKIGITNECIVRSSANVENTTEHDCPGIFESYVCHDRKNIIQVIKRVWDSTTADLAHSFFLNSLDTNALRMAVIVQHIIRGNYNLVIQSYDVIEDKNRAIIEYCNGELNSIVDDIQNASLCYIDYNQKELTGCPLDLPLEHIKKDCKLIETIIGGKAEIEAQIENGKIWYLQARLI